ncbi:DNA-3-methyladenine glycosylase [Lapidilactobacillus achengensis]|uniref:Putative 3-methyladenine DNA glycosylase n=1 Tax=Lapidilactobacillus achengensis TaxID=2486000 RepID=A0ABW1UKX3_9LACO|nr:DNA-3-methyladenine glycosylase [Lapidilactobacillus achengensis]
MQLMPPITDPRGLDPAFFTGRDTMTITQDLLGKLLIYDSPAGQVGGYIVEAEAYLGAADPGAHAYQNRRVPSNEPLYGPPGTIYIYAIRGFYDFDVVTQAAEEPQGILIRALEPAIGLDLMRHNRPKQPDLNLTSGPGKLMRALNIHDTKLNGLDFHESPLKIISQASRTPTQVTTTARIGVRTGTNWSDHYRAFVTGNPFVSKIRKRDYNLNDYGWIS